MVKLKNKLKKFLIAFLCVMAATASFVGCADGYEALGTLSSSSSEESSSTEVVHTYNITYHVVLIYGATVEVDYLGTWEDYWRGNLEICEGYVKLPATYKSNESTTIDNLPVGEVNLNKFTPSYKRRGTFSAWYVDEECQQPFDGWISSGGSADVHLYTKWTTTYTGPWKSANNG